MSAIPKETSITLPVSGMSCASCSARLQRQLSAGVGVTLASVNLAASQAVVQGTMTVPEVVAVVEQCGFVVPRVSETFIVQGISCAACVRKIENQVRPIVGVSEALVNLATGELTVTYIPEVVTFELLQSAVTAVGYELSRSGDGESLLEVEARERRQEARRFLQRLTIGLLLTLANMVVMLGPLPGLSWLPEAHSPLNNWLQWLLITPVMFWVGWPFHRGAYAALRHGSTNMNTLIAVGTFSAYFYSLTITVAPDLLTLPGVHAGVYFDTAGAIIVLIMLGRYLESRAKERTSHALRALMGLVPRTARVLRKGQEREISAEELRIGDRVMVRPGERIPVDGVIDEGESTLDESLITGESLPVFRGMGDAVRAGAVNQTGSFIFNATRVGRETTLARIIALVRQAQGVKPPIAALADTIASWFVPVVFGIALLTFVVWLFFGPPPALTYALANFIAVLIIACPCALGLATPTAIMVGSGRGAELGILVRSGEALERLEKATVALFDKTGTLTHGRPELTDWSGDLETLHWVASLEYRSEHPLARAIVTGAEQRGVPPLLTPEQFSAMPGRGISGQVAGHRLLVGTRRWLEQEGVDCSTMAPALEPLEQAGKSVMLVVVDDRLAGMLAVADTIKPESRSAVLDLQALGVEVVLLSGDNRQTAQAVADQLGIKRVIAEVLPEGKAAEVQRLQALGAVVAMVGDGVNDAPALACADIGIAMGTGADVAMEAASVTLLRGDPHGVGRAIALSRATMKTIRQNLVLAFLYNVLLIPVAAGVLYPGFGLLLSPVLAAAAMGMSSVTVVTNALRLRGFKG